MLRSNHQDNTLVRQCFTNLTNYNSDRHEITVLLLHFPDETREAHPHYRGAAHAKLPGVERYNPITLHPISLPYVYYNHTSVQSVHV